MTDYGEVGRAFEDSAHQTRPEPDSDGVVYGTEQGGEVSVEGVDAALAALGDDGCGQATLAAFDIAASDSSPGGDGQ